MKTNSVVFLNQALRDLDQIWFYTARHWSKRRANSYAHLIKETCDNLAKKCLIGRSYKMLDKDILGFHIGRHIIFYSFVSDKKICVMRILHDQMNIPSRF